MWGRGCHVAAASTVTALEWQVALLFIVTAGDSVAHEPAWRSWFAAAEGLVPASVASPDGTRQHVPSLSRCARMLVGTSSPAQTLKAGVRHRRQGAIALTLSTLPARCSPTQVFACLAAPVMVRSLFELQC